MLLLLCFFWIKYINRCFFLSLKPTVIQFICVGWSIETRTNFCLFDSFWNKEKKNFIFHNILLKFSHLSLHCLFNLFRCLDCKRLEETNKESKKKGGHILRSCCGGQCQRIQKTKTTKILEEQLEKGKKEWWAKREKKIFYHHQGHHAVCVPSFFRKRKGEFR